jgi:hypothetical protein
MSIESIVVCFVYPLLFALFISGMGDWMQKPDELDLPMGAPLLLDSFMGGTLDSGRVTHAVFADDLVICELSQHRTQVQISRLAEYAASKGLTVNVGKCASMVCNDKRLSGRAEQAVLYQGVRIPVVDGCNRTSQR